jgi:hypothetical protein
MYAHVETAMTKIERKALFNNLFDFLVSGPLFLTIFMVVEAAWVYFLYKMARCLFSLIW